MNFDPCGVVISVWEMNFVVQGIAVGFPWNALLSSTDYYREQLNDTASLSTLEAALTLAYVSMNLIAFAWLHRPRREKESSHAELGYIRLYFAVNLFTFLVLGISPWLPAQVSTEHGLFGVVVVVSALLGATSAYFQHAIFALAARDGPSRTRAFLFGFALAGTLASVFALATRSFTDPESTAALNFGVTELCLVLGLITFICRKTKTSLVNEAAVPNSHDVNRDEVEHLVPETVDRKKLRLSLLVVALSMSGSLMVFPALVASLKPVSPGQDPHEFTSLLFLCFNIGDLTGRGLSSALAHFSDSTLFVGILARTCSLALFGLCNRSDTPTSGTLGDGSVYALVLLQGVFGGCLFAAAAAHAPKATPGDPGKAGKLVAVTVAVSLAAGASGGTVLISLLE